MDIRTYKKRFLSLGRRQRLLVLVVVNITVIWLVLFFALLKVERRTSDQYQNQYYGQFEANLDAFLNIRDSTDNFCRDLKITPSILSFLENSGPKDLERCLKQEDTRIAELYLLDAVPQVDIGEELGLSRSAISKRLLKIVDRIERTAKRLNMI